MTVFLGSSSPRRKDILDILSVEFKTMKPETDESPFPGEKAYFFCERVSREKNEHLLKKIDISDDFLLITADTVVSLGGTIYGKPSNHDEAVSMIMRLSGKAHEVITAITMSWKLSDKISSKTSSLSTTVSFKKLSLFEITDYLSRINFLDKAGAYAAQEHSDLIIDSTTGSLSNVVGFPIRLFFNMLQETGLTDKLS